MNTYKLACNVSLQTTTKIKPQPFKEQTGKHIHRASTLINKCKTLTIVNAINMLKSEITYHVKTKRTGEKDPRISGGKNHLVFCSTANEKHPK